MIWRRIIRRFRSTQPETQPPTLADVFNGDASLAAYQRVFRLHTAATWDLVESTQSDLLGLVVGRVPAETGAGAILAVAVLFGNDPDAAERSRALLATVLDALPPDHARIIVLALADAWQTAERQPYDGRGQVIRVDVLRAIRRLSTTNLPDREREVMRRIERLVGETDHVLSDER